MSDRGEGGCREHRPGGIHQSLKSVPKNRVNVWERLLNKSISIKGIIQTSSLFFSIFNKNAKQNAYQKSNHMQPLAPIQMAASLWATVFDSNTINYFLGGAVTDCSSTQWHLLAIHIAK